MIKYIKRDAEKQIKSLLKDFPAVSVIGSRQVGKTMMTKHLFPNWTFFDLERVDHYDRISSDIEFFFKTEQKNICFDEAQCLPVLFSHLRSVIDRHPKRRFLLLGSANPLLIKNISESLAGRIATVELFPFTLFELKKEIIKDLWFFGGYPALNQFSPKNKKKWLKDYTTSFIERDIPKLGLSISTLRLRRLLQMTAYLHGTLLNINQIASSLGCSTTAVYDALDVLEESFLIRRLQPLHANLKKRIVKSPKIYIRDSGILHQLLKLNSYQDLLAHPIAGFSWEGFAIEQIIASLSNAGMDFDCYFWRTHAGGEVDFVLEINGKRILLEFKLGTITDNRSLKGLNQAINDLNSDLAAVVSFIGDSYSLSDKIIHCSLKEIIKKLKIFF